MKHLSALDLEFLKLEGTQITSRAANYINQFKKLRELNVTDTKFGDEGFRELKNYRIFSINAAACPKLSDKGLKLIVEKWPNLTGLDLSYNKLSSKGLEEIGKLKRLRKIALTAMPISSSLAKIIATSPIQHINIALAKISVKDLDKIASSPNLMSISAMTAIPGLRQWEKNAKNKYPNLRIFSTTNMDAKKSPAVEELHQFSDFIAPPDLDSQ